MAKVNFLVEGEQKTVNLKPGERLLDAIYRLSLDEIGMGECGGNCVCSTCHVYVVEGGEQFGEPSIDEEDMLDTVPTVQENSRLGCQCIVSDNDKDITVKVPE